MFGGEFDRRFERARKRHDMMFRIVMTIIVITFIAIISFWIFAGTVVIKAMNQVEQHGVRGVVEQIWCGKDQPNCLEQK